MPDQFWSLSLREFWIKHAAFMRAENRKRALGFELAGMVSMADEKAKRVWARNTSVLTQYPIKPWALAEHTDTEHDGEDHDPN